MALYENRNSDFFYKDAQNGASKLQFSSHLHYHVEMVYMLEGSSTAYIDSEKYTVEAGDFFIVFPNQIHRFESFTTEKYKLFIISPDLTPELSKVFSSKLPNSPLLKNAAENTALMHAIDTLSLADDKKGKYSDVYLKGSLLVFFYELFRALDLEDMHASDSEALKSLVNFCSQNFSQDLSLSMLEEELHISKYYISHLFSDKLNIRFNDYINSLRISEACRHLRQSEKSVTEISELVGFNTLRTFNRAFIKQMHCSPSAYRKSKTEGANIVHLPLINS